ncbi:AlpA family transcriptional regulator [Acinetobacter sp. P8-3-8]|uniref:helix-turn-helix transcriptional regulator n=1 Tax=Acinetobacter sp. P8-3-8 TaxID=1029823 RepID=UPI00024865AD|nr:transcriptional regulator [Acinetobacter sp. P8-3-8]
MTISPIRVKLETACKILDISRETLRYLIRTDKTFPKAIKTGDSKQSPVFFDYADLMNWHNNQKRCQTNANLEA